MTNLKTVDEMASGVYDYESAFDALTQYRQSHCDELVRRVVEMGAYELDESGNPLLRQEDVLTIVKEVYQVKE